MSLTHRERDIVDLLREHPLLDAAAIAERLGATKGAVSVHLSNLTRKGVILGRGYVVRPEAQSVVVVGGAPHRPAHPAEISGSTTVARPDEARDQAGERARAHRPNVDRPVRPERRSSANA